MNNTDTGVHPITTHVREAAGRIRSANHATYHDRRDAPQLYETIGALSELLRGLPQLVAHLATVIDRAEPVKFYDDRGTNVVRTLRYAAIELDELRSSLLDGCQNHIAEAFNAIGHVGTITTDD